MAKQQRGLGKGLSAVLGGDVDMSSFRRPVQYVNNVNPDREAREGEIILINIDDIEPNPYQPRVTFDPQALEELASSIRTLGLIQPITVRSVHDGKYQIISGERRFRASRIAGLSTIPAFVRNSDDRGMLEMAIVENVQRADLDPIETAMSYQRLIDECSLTQEQMADRIGKNRVSVTNFLRLLKLPAKVQYDLKVGNISVGHAKVLLGVEDPMQQEALCDEIIRQGLSVRALEQRIKAGNMAKKKARFAPDTDADLPDEYYNILEIVGKYFDNNISMKRNSDGKGVMTVRFNSDKQMRDFLNALKDSKL